MDKNAEKTIEELHDEACAAGQEYYVDPSTNRMVFTRVYHAAKGYCCDSGCRHCPYKHSAESKQDAFFSKKEEE
jgi:hypothetical protein